MDPRITKLEGDFRETEARLSAGGLPSSEFKTLSLKHAQLSPVVAKARALRKLEEELAGLKALESDPELRSMAAAERPALESRLEALEAEIQLDLLPKDPEDDKDVYLEV